MIMGLGYLRKLTKLDRLIRMRLTGSPDQLAVLLGVSRRNLYSYLNDLKEMGAEIGYCRKRKTFYYKNNLAFVCGFMERNTVVHNTGLKITR